jgi:hypothetical protein
MPEMLQYCGMTMRVSKRAHQACDPALGIVGRKMANAVHLENNRRNGSAHDGCEAGCLIFWKEAWLRRLVRPRHLTWRLHGMESIPNTFNVRTMLSNRALGSPQAPAKAIRPMVCQNTQIKFATQPLECVGHAPVRGGLRLG